MLINAFEPFAKAIKEALPKPKINVRDESEPTVFKVIKDDANNTDLIVDVPQDWGKPF